MKQSFIGFFTGTCLIASAVMFMGASSPYTTYDIDDVYSKVKSIQYDVSDIKSDISWMKRHGVEYDGGSVDCN